MTNLFRDEVYKKFYKKLEGRSKHAQIEDAIRSIKHDKKLMDFIQDYARKNAIDGLMFGKYGSGNPRLSNFRDLSIRFWEKGDEKMGVPYPVFLSIGPEPNPDWTPPIFLNYHLGLDGKKVDTSRYYSSEIDDRFYKGAHRLTLVLPENQICFWPNYSRLVDIGLFEDVSTRDIFKGLERAIRKLL